MRTTCLVIIAGLALAACNREPTFDVSSLSAYQRSLEAVTAKLNIPQRNRLNLALVTLVTGNSLQANTIELANPKTVANLVTLDSAVNPLVILDRLRPQIDGRDAASVISRVADELDNEISDTVSRFGAARSLLDAVTINNPRYYWDKRSNLPALEFSVYNGGKSSVSRIFLNAVITQTGESGKYMMGGLTYQFGNGLDPGVAMPVKLTVSRMDDQTRQKLQGLYNADVTVRVTNIVKANGDRLFAADDALESMRQKRDFLRGG
jgi:hypothetical protein